MMATWAYQKIAITSGFDPGCVKTLCRCYDSLVILRRIDEALR